MAGINDRVMTPDGIGTVDTAGLINVLVKFMPEDGDWQPPCEFRIYKLEEVEVIDELAHLSGN